MVNGRMQWCRLFGRRERCGWGRGDVHLETIDHCRYEARGLGTYTMIKASDGSLDVQCLFHKIGEGTDIRDIAIKQGGHVVQFKANMQEQGAPPNLVVDGNAVSSDTWSDGPISVKRDGKFLFYKSEKFSCTVSSHETFKLINVAYQISGALADKTSGLYGNFDGKKCDSGLRRCAKQNTFRVEGAANLVTNAPELSAEDKSFCASPNPQWKDAETKKKGEEYCHSLKKNRDSEEEMEDCLYDCAETGNCKVDEVEQDGINHELKKEDLNNA